MDLEVLNLSKGRSGIRAFGAIFVEKHFKNLHFNKTGYNEETRNKYLMTPEVLSSQLAA